MLENIWFKFIRIKHEDGKKKKLIVNKNGDIINTDPTEEDLKGLHEYLIKTKDILKLSEENKKDYLLQFLRYFYEKEGRVPKTKDFVNNPKYPSFKTYENIFGSWNNAIRQAGLIPIRDLSDEELLSCQIMFYIENERSPTEKDFDNNPKYPGSNTYIRRFGTWHKSLKLVGLDVDSMVRKGIIETKDQKARLAEILVLDHFTEKDKVVDMAGENRDNPYDGICPNGQKYDVKGAGLYENFGWDFKLKNDNRDEIEWYYLLAFNVDYTKLLHAWRIPSWDLTYIKNDRLKISINRIEYVKQYEITDIFLPIFGHWLNNIK